LFQQESDVIVEIVLQALQTIDPKVCQGTFILDGQRYNEKAECLIRFDLPEGTTIGVGNDFWERMGNSSSAIAEKAINTVLDDYESSNAPSGIFEFGEHKELKVLILNATHGRFLCSFYANFKGDGDQESSKILVIVAELLGELCKNDPVLVKSVEETHKAENLHLNDGTSEADKLYAMMQKSTVQMLFSPNSNIRAIQSLHAWNSLSSQGRGRRKPFE